MLIFVICFINYRSLPSVYVYVNLQKQSSQWYRIINIVCAWHHDYYGIASLRPWFALLLSWLCDIQYWHQNSYSTTAWSVLAWYWLQNCNYRWNIDQSLTYKRHTISRPYGAIITCQPWLLERQLTGWYFAVYKCVASSNNHVWYW